MLNLEITSIFGLENIPFFKKGGGIHIKKENRGKFTKSAKAAGESVLEHAAHVLSDPNATPLQKKRANFARNAAKWKHQYGGPILKMLTGDSLISESTKVEKPIIIPSKKINKTQLLDNSWERTSDNEVNVYPNLKDDKYVQEFFLYDYAPRFKRLNNFASQDYVKAALNIYKNTPITLYKEDNNTGGYQTGGVRKNYNNFMLKAVNGPTYTPPSVYLNDKYKVNRPTLVHELTHAFRQGYLGLTGDTRFSSKKSPLHTITNKEIGHSYSGSGYSNSEKNILNDTYNMEGYKIDYDPLHEKGTTNTEVRFRLWKELYDQLGRRPSLEETDNYIKNYDGVKLLNIIRRANAYGRTMYNNRMSTNKVRNALINVAQNNSDNPYLLNDQTYYAKQGGKTRKPSKLSRPWGHRSILDNGWQSTKQLKNKKNVYGK